MARIVIKNGESHIQFYNLQEMLDVTKIADELRASKPSIDEFETVLKNAGLITKRRRIINDKR